MYSFDEIKAVDSEIAQAIVEEQERQNSHIELIASENWVSKAVMATMGSPLTNKYAEGYPAKRYYGGCQCVDVVENLAIERAKELFGCDYANVQPHSGAQANMAVQFAILNPGDEVIIPSPYWLSYPEIVKMAGGVPVFVVCNKEQDYKITAEMLEAACTSKTKAFILNSPNNPTGVVYTREELEALAKVIVEKDIYVVADEMYENLVYENQEVVSIASLNEEIYKRTITCSGVSKSYAMTGWRIGYTGSSEEIAKLMGSIQSHQTSNPNSIAQVAAIEALSGDQEPVYIMQQEFDARRRYMYDRICHMSYVEAVKPMGAFYVFVDITQLLNKTYKGELIGDVYRLAEILLDDYNTAVIPCADFGFADHIRLSYAIAMEQIEKGLDRIEQFISEVK